MEQSDLKAMAALAAVLIACRDSRGTYPDDLFAADGELLGYTRTMCGVEHVILRTRDSHATAI